MSLRIFLCLNSSRSVWPIKAVTSCISLGSLRSQTTRKIGRFFSKWSFHQLVRVIQGVRLEGYSASKWSCEQQTSENCKFDKQTYQTKPTKPNLPNLPNQTNRTKPTKPNLPNLTYQTKLKIAYQAYWTRPSKPKLLVKAVNAWVRSAFGNVSQDALNWSQIFYKDSQCESL